MDHQNTHQSKLGNSGEAPMVTKLKELKQAYLSRYQQTHPQSGDYEAVAEDMDRVEEQLDEFIDFVDGEVRRERANHGLK